MSKLTESPQVKGDNFSMSWPPPLSPFLLNPGWKFMSIQPFILLTTYMWGARSWRLTLFTCWPLYTGRKIQIRRESWINPINEGPPRPYEVFVVTMSPRNLQKWVFFDKIHRETLIPEFDFWFFKKRTKQNKFQQEWCWPSQAKSNQNKETEDSIVTTAG